MRRKYSNEIIEDHGGWLLVDISTAMFPNTTMAVDTEVFNLHEGGRIRAESGYCCKYIIARYSKFDEFGLQKNISFHRDVINAEQNKEVDHIRHGTMSFVDNRSSNLRLVTPSQNAQNKALFKSNRAGATGVSWHKSMGKWRARIKINNKEKHLGYFDNIDFAIGARRQAEREYFGEYAYSANNNGQMSATEEIKPLPVRPESVSRLIELKTGLDKAAFALFQIKRMRVSDEVADFARKEHEKACKIIDRNPTDG